MHVDSKIWSQLATDFGDLGEGTAPSWSHLHGYLVRAGIDVHHVLTSTAALPDPVGDWKRLKQAAIGEWIDNSPWESGPTKFYERSFWEEYWLLVVRWLHEIPGSGIVLPSNELRELEMPEGWDEDTYFVGFHEKEMRRGIEKVACGWLSFGVCHVSEAACRYVQKRVDEWNERSADRVLFGIDNEPSDAEAPTPSYDKERRELTYDGEVIKQFKQPAGNQELILLAFEEEGWPTRVDDPLQRGQLGQTIRDLNRNMRIKRIRFASDGKREGVIWERET